MEPIRNTPAAGSAGDSNPRQYARPKSGGSTLRGYDLVGDDKSNAYTMDWEPSDADNERLLARKRGAVTEEYPSGFRMVFVVVALVLSIFVFALDSVTIFALPPFIHGKQLLIWCLS